MDNDKKEMILNVLKQKGPSLPVHIAKQVGLDTLFTGAYLSELYNEKSIKISNLKVGNSPLYYIEGQEPMLENFVDSLNSKEKEACLLLKKYSYLKESEQLPAIRVALKNIKDFAFPVEIAEEVYWKYLTAEESQSPVLTIEAPNTQDPPATIKSEPTSIQKPEIIDIPSEEEEEEEEEPQEQAEEQETNTSKITPEQLKELAEEEIKKELEQETGETGEEIQSVPEPDSQQQNPGDHQNTSEDIVQESPKPKPTKTTKKDPKQKFLDNIQLYLDSKQVELIEILKHDKKQILAKVKINQEQYLLAAFNKKRFDEADLLRVYRKYSEEDLSFYFLSKGELSKKTSETIRAAKKLKALGIFEEQ
jgi:hypothetical protein